MAYLEDEKRFEEFMKASIGQAGPVYKSRADHPYWKTDPNTVAKTGWPVCSTIGMRL